MRRTRVKVCGITSAGDAHHAIAAGADAIGLVFYPKSPRNVSIEQAKTICAGLPPFVSVVALCVDKPAEEVRALLSELPVGLLQFHGEESPDYCQQFDTPFIKALRVHSDVDVSRQIARYNKANGILLDTYRKGIPGGTGESFDWQLIPEAHRAGIVLAGGLSADNVAAAIAAVGPYAVDVSGGVERAPGVKDPAKINAFIEQVRKSDQ